MDMVVGLDRYPFFMPIQFRFLLIHSCFVSSNADIIRISNRMGLLRREYTELEVYEVNSCASRTESSNEGRILQRTTNNYYVESASLI